MTCAMVTRLDAEGDRRIQLPLIKPDSKEICKNGKTTPLFSLAYFADGNKSFPIKLLFVNMKWVHY